MALKVSTTLMALNRSSIYSRKTRVRDGIVPAKECVVRWLGGGSGLPSKFTKNHAAHYVIEIGGQKHGFTGNLDGLENPADIVRRRYSSSLAAVPGKILIYRITIFDIRKHPVSAYSDKKFHKMINRLSKSGLLPEFHMGPKTVGNEELVEGLNLALK